MREETAHLHYLLSSDFLVLPIDTYHAKAVANHAQLLTNCITAGYLVPATPAEAIAKLHKKDALIDALRAVGGKVTGTKEKLALQLEERFPDAVQQLIGERQVLRRTEKGSEELLRLAKSLDQLNKQALQAEWHHYYQLALRDYRRTDGIVGMQVIALEAELCHECAHLPGIYTLAEAPKRIHLSRCQRSPYPCRLTHECVFDFDEDAQLLGRHQPAPWKTPPSSKPELLTQQGVQRTSAPALEVITQADKPAEAYQPPPPSPYDTPKTKPGVLGNPVIRFCLYVLAIPMIVIMLVALFG